jgi:DNA-binding IclR family transcriptional regulator
MENTIENTIERYEIRSVSRALKLLKFFSEGRTEISASEISQLIGLNLSSSYRLVKTLQIQDFLEQNPDNRKYRLGVSCLEMGSAYLQHNDLHSRALPHLHKLREDCKETVHMATLLGEEVVYIEKLEALMAIGVMGSRVGRRSPAHCTGLGKSMLAYKAEHEIHDLYTEGTLTRYTPTTISTMHDLIKEMDLIKAQGYAYDNEEHVLDVKCIAAHIRNQRHQVVAAISVAGPAERIDRAIAEDNLIPKVIEASRAITKSLGGK